MSTVDPNCYKTVGIWVKPDENYLDFLEGPMSIPLQFVISASPLNLRFWQQREGSPIYAEGWTRR